MADRSAVVPNTTSEARDHLANERTFNAWIRTALGVVALGVAVPKLVDHEQGAILAGAGLVLVGGVCLVYASYRYVRVSRMLLAGEFPVARRGPVVVGAAALIMALAALLFVLSRSS
jgi:putative membrane protein